MDDDEEYRDGQFEYATVSSLIEEIVDQYQLRVYVYMESDNYDIIRTDTFVHDNENDEIIDEVQFSTLRNLVADIIRDRDNAERSETIAMIYDIVHEAIHIDDDPELDDDDFQGEEE